MSEWDMVMLGEVCSSKSSSLTQGGLTPDSGNYEVYGASGKITKISTYQHEHSYIGIVKDGAGIGRVYHLPEKTSVIGTIQSLIPNEKVNIRYFYYALIMANLGKYFSGCTIPHIYFKVYKKEEIPLPPLEKQQEIAEELDNITELIALRKQQLEKLDLLVKAKFVEMFGDPVENPMGWGVVSFGKTGKFKNGMNFASNEKGISIPYLGVGDFKNLSKIIGISTFGEVSLTEMPSEDYLLKNDDIVFVRSNGNKNLVGRCIAVYPNGTELTFSGFCIRYRNTNQKFKTSFLLELLKHKSSREMMLGRGANIQNLNQQILNVLPVISPPLPLQEQFAHYVQAVEETRKEMEQGLEKLELLYRERMQRWFGA